MHFKDFFITKSQTKDSARVGLSAEELGAVFSYLPDPIIVTNKEFTIIYTNTAVENLTGLDKNQLIGKPIVEAIHVYFQGQEIAPSEYLMRNTKDQPFFEKELQLGKQEAKEQFVKLYPRQIPESDGVIILSLHDVTTEKEVENMKIDFVSMAAHELRTPLTSLKGYLYMYTTKYSKLINPEQATFLLRMNTSTQRLIGLVENLLNISRIEKGVMNLHIEPIDWIANVTEIISEIIDQAKDKKVHLEIVTPPGSLSNVLADKFRINEVLLNLLSNAIVYTQTGGQIKVWFDEKENEVITHIMDTGPGIPKEAIPHLFTKFFRVAGKLEQGSKGTGLGLYITKSIVDMHHGRIWVESEVGKGSTFSFALPKTVDKPEENTLHG